MTALAIDAQLLDHDLPEDYHMAAHYWRMFGLRVAPMLKDKKHTVVEWPVWDAQWEQDAADAVERWFAEGKYALCALINHEVIVLDADTPESQAALYRIEKDFDLEPNLVVKTRKGVHHYYRRAAGTYAIGKGFSSENHPERIDIVTGRSAYDGRHVAVLPPSPGKRVDINEAENVNDLVEVGQDFIDAVFRHNGDEAPRKPSPRTAPIVTCSHEELDKELSLLDPDGLDYDDWLKVGMAIHFETKEEGYGIWLGWSEPSSLHDGSEMLKKWDSFGSCETPATISTIKKMSRKKRPYAEILEAAKAMDADAEPDEISALTAECGPLSRIEQRKVFIAIKKATDMPLADLKAAMNESAEKSELDQLALAHEVVKDVGPDNILAAQTFVWWWDQCGVWRRLEDRSVKQLVQVKIPSKVDAVSRNLVDGVTDLLKTTVYRTWHEFDIGPPETVNTPNGELHREGSQWVLRPHNREHYRTTQVPVAYDPEARAPRFVQFLSEIFKADYDADDKAQAMLEMIGYSLMAHCRHERFIILIGSGANGKSVLMQVMEALAGRQNVAAVQPSEFANRFQRAHLHGKLVNIVSELKQGAVIDDEALKGITSGEPTTVENKHKDPFDMHPFSTCWFGTNHMPHTRDFSDALFRRALLVEFNNTFRPELGNCDPGLKDALMDELPGILNMALTAYGEALEHGFTMPASSLKALDVWRLEADQVAQFVQDECEITPANSEQSNPLFGAYREWAAANGIKQSVNARSFKDRMKRLGIHHEHKRDGKFYVGIRCRNIPRF